ncbi:MAG: Ig-like domain-containing protein, partial [Pseudohongiellaceae bacterium]
MIFFVFSILLAACGDERSTSTEPDTVAEAPAIVNTTPADMATDVSRTDPVTATFTETILLSSIDNTGFTLEGPDGYVASSVRAYDAVATLTPDNSLTLLTPYTATLASSISGLADNALGVEYNWSFITEDGHWGRAARIESHSGGGSAFPQIA